MSSRDNGESSLKKDTRSTNGLHLEDWDAMPETNNGHVEAPHIPTYTYHNTNHSHTLLEQPAVVAKSEPAPTQPPTVSLESYVSTHQHQPMGMSGSLSAAQSQYLSQLTQQSQRHDNIEAHRLLVEAYNEAALSWRTCREWFQKFKNGDFDIEGKDRSGRPKIYEDAELEKILEEDSSQTQKEHALTLEVTQYDKIILLHDNARLHVAVPVKNYLKELDWEVLPHPPYSPDIAPSNYHLFRSMARALSAVVHIMWKYQKLGVYTSNYGVYGSSDITSQRKPQRARVPPPSKIPSTAVEMPGGTDNTSGAFLDVQFGALEPDALVDAPAAAAPAPSAHQTKQVTSQNETQPAVAHEPAADPHAYSNSTSILNDSLSVVETTSSSQSVVVENNTTSATSLDKQLTVSMKQLNVGVSDVPASSGVAGTGVGVAAVANSASSAAVAATAVHAQQPQYAQSHHRPKTVGQPSVYPGHHAVSHHPPVYGANVYAPQVNSTNASLTAASAMTGTAYPPTVTLPQYHTPTINSYQFVACGDLAHVTIISHKILDSVLRVSRHHQPLGGPAAVSFTVTPRVQCQLFAASGLPLSSQMPITVSNYKTSSSASVYGGSALYTAAPYNAYQPAHQPKLPTKDNTQYDSAVASSNSLTSTATTQAPSAKVTTTTVSSGSGNAGAGGAAYVPAAQPAAFYTPQQPAAGQYAAYEEAQMMRGTLPHHMGTYYEMGYGVGAAREGTFGLGSGERFGRTDAASPQQVAAAALPPGYAFAYYQGPPPTTYQYGVYPTAYGGGGSSVTGVTGVSGNATGKVSTYTQQQPPYDVHDTYKAGTYVIAGPYTGNSSKTAAGATAAELTNTMYAKAHVTLNKVNSYEKATFPGTPPPFGAASHHQLYIQAPHPGAQHHHAHHHQPQHQGESGAVAGVGGGARGGGGAGAGSTKAAGNKPAYSQSYWAPTN
ncbi:Mariner Mos1 transposase [Eumeta japonica]|uniref:Mariner Mos1 transposase n=1 Tax=Eumeta variegata TaxID=151549 RepID=A0A4C1WX70_EUMVA|nr:Mariner Mos1 transposase [Eumeta japonica]